MGAGRYIGAIVGGAAAVAGIFGAGYALGARVSDDAERLVIAAVRLLSENASEESRTELAAVRDAVERRDLRTALEILPSNVTPVRQADCHPSGAPFAVTAGALVRNCETGMSAVVATLNSNRTLQATIGGRLRSGAPGTAFADSSGRHPDCFLVYHNLEAAAEPLTARMSFDCPAGDNE